MNEQAPAETFLRNQSATDIDLVMNHAHPSPLRSRCPTLKPRSYETKTPSEGERERERERERAREKERKKEKKDK